MGAWPPAGWNLHPSGPSAALARSQPRLGRPFFPCLTLPADGGASADVGTRATCKDSGSCPALYPSYAELSNRHQLFWSRTPQKRVTTRGAFSSQRLLLRTGHQPPESTDGAPWYGASGSPAMRTVSGRGGSARSFSLSRRRGSAGSSGTTRPDRGGGSFGEVAGRLLPGGVDHVFFAA